MRFNPGAFDAWLANIGQQVAWRRSYACACVNPESGAPDPKHALCQGKGRLWDAPIETVAGITAQKVTAQVIAAGMYEAGDVTITIPQSSPMWDCGLYDRILLLNNTNVFSRPMKRGAPNERLLFTVESLIRAFVLHPTTRQPVDIPLPVVDLNGNVSWPAGDGPAPGVQYSLTGVKFDEYFVYMDQSNDRNEHSGMRMPKRLQARLFDLFGR